MEKTNILCLDDDMLIEIFRYFFDKKITIENKTFYNLKWISRKFWYIYKILFEIYGVKYKLIQRHMIHIFIFLQSQYLLNLKSLTILL